MATNDKPDAGRPTMPSPASRNPWEYPGWPSSAPRFEQVPPAALEGDSIPPPAGMAQPPRTTSVSPIAMPVQAPEPARPHDLLPRIMTLTAVAITVAVVGVYVARGPRASGWAGSTPRLGADNMGQIVRRTIPRPAPKTPAPPATFNLVASDLAMRGADQSAAACAKGVEPQRTDVRVTFGASGNVVYVLSEDRPYLGDKVADCIEEQFRGVKVPPFEGNNVTVTRRFSIP